MLGGREPSPQPSKLMYYAAINNLVASPRDESPDDVGILVEPEFNTLAQQLPEMIANQGLARFIERFRRRHIDERNPLVGEHGFIE